MDPLRGKQEQAPESEHLGPGEAHPKKTNEVLEVDDALYNRLMSEHRDLPEDIVGKLAENSLRNDFIVQEYLANRDEYGKTIIFADRWFQCVYLKEKLAKVGVRADAVYSHIDADPGSAEARNRRSADENHKIIRQFKDDELDVLINVRMLTEGTDVPNTRTVFVTRETTSSILLTQMIGRALRGEKAGGGPEKKDANIVFFTDTWRKVIHWASYTAGGGVSETQPVKGYYPIEMISIRLVEELIKRINSGRSFQTEPFSNLMPVGWYQTTYVSLGEGDEMGSFDEFVMVYNFQEKGFQDFIRRNSENLSEEWEKENLSMDWALGETRRLADGSFDLDEENLGETLVFDLVRIARHMAQNRVAPKFFPFEERNRYDLDKIAKDHWNMNSLDQRSALEKIFQQPGGLWSTFYKTFDRFKTAYDGSLNRFMELLITGSDAKAVIPKPVEPPPERGRIRELSEDEKELVFRRDHFRCLCCGAEKGRAVKLQVDHILPDRMGGETSFDNSQTLCRFFNTTKGINELNFRIHGSLLSVPKVLEVFGPTPFDDFQSFIRRAVNFFYHCGAVADCRRQKGTESGSGKTLVIQLYPGNNPNWLKQDCNKLLASIRSNFSHCGSISTVSVEADGERVSEEFKPLAGDDGEAAIPAVTIDPGILPRPKQVMLKRKFGLSSISGKRRPGGLEKGRFLA
ncbi:MAG: HNH endonuclease [Armatimonadetes bacterium]|nr:HNH endonuclease [Armatimonadota bacterium]